MAVRARRVRRWFALELGSTNIRPEVIDRLVISSEISPELVTHAAVFKPFPWRTFLLLDADRLNSPGGAENNRLAEALSKAIRENLAGFPKLSSLPTDDLPTHTLAMLVEALAYDAAGYFGFLHDPHHLYDHQNDPVTLYSAYAKLRVKFPDLGPALAGNARVLESRWLVENGSPREGFYLAQNLACNITAGRIGAWLRNHPEARQPRIPVKGEPNQPVFGPFIGCSAPLTKNLTGAEEDRLVAAFDDWADDLWRDLARRTGHHRLYFLCMARQDRLMDGVNQFLSSPGLGPGMRELGKLLASRPDLGAKIVPEQVPPQAVCQVAGGMLDGGSAPEAVAAFVRRWLPCQPRIFNHLTTDELRPVAELGSCGP